MDLVDQNQIHFVKSHNVYGSYLKPDIWKKGMKVVVFIVQHAFGIVSQEVSDNAGQRNEFAALY